MFEKILEIVQKGKILLLKRISTKISIKIIDWKYFNRPNKLLSNFKVMLKVKVKNVKVMLKRNVMLDSKNSCKRKDCSLQQKFQSK